MRDGDGVDGGEDDSEVGEFERRNLNFLPLTTSSLATQLSNKHNIYHSLNMGLFAAAAPEQCYFCGSAVGPITRTPQAWSCPACGCWNGRDRAGRIDGDHPAMRDSTMNEANFSRRGE